MLIDPTDDPAALGDFLAGSGVSADDLAATPQDARWHAEGDVWIHTRMVVEALLALPAFAALDEHVRRLVFTAALTHDLGKPSTTREEHDGSISSRGHSARGEHLVRRWLWEAGVPFADREAICAMVRHHQVPFFGITRDDAEAVAGRVSLRVRNDWLALVAEADGRGRRTADPAEHQKMLDHTALWVEHCRELGCLDRPRVFASDHARVLHFERGRAADVAPHDDSTCEVIVMSGLPGAGKDTWLSFHHPELPRVSLDALRDAEGVDPDDSQKGIVHAAREAARVHLRAARPFAWNATNIGERVRSSVIELCRAYRARVHIVYVEAPAEVIAERNRDRVPHRAIARMLERWSVPTLDECHRLTLVGV